jgi:hypothetical protein
MLEPGHFFYSVPMQFVRVQCASVLGLMRQCLGILKSYAGLLTLVVGQALLGEGFIPDLPALLSQYTLVR